MAKRTLTSQLLLGSVLSGALVFSALSPAAAIVESSPMQSQTSVTASSGGLWKDGSNRRLAGQDRYETAARISADTYPTPSVVKNVVVATGLDFPDSLSAAPFAAKVKGPLLMTHPTSLSAPTLQEINRLKPDNIYIVGGTGAVSTRVEQSLRSVLPPGGTLKRLGGIDRYETSVKIAEEGWPGGTQPEVFFATGADFPDALSAGAAAGVKNAPVILIPPANVRMGPQTRSFLTKKKTSTVHIVGGTAVVSETIASDARSVASVKTVNRLEGSDRYLTSATVAKEMFVQPTTTYFANGMEFPDALTGASAAGVQGATLLLSRFACIPSSVYDANERLVPADTILLGGTASLAETVQHGNECMTRPSGSSNASFTGMQQLYEKINKARFDAGRTGLRLADSKVGTPAYSWASSRKFSRNTSLASQQPWVKSEAIARSSAAPGSQVNAMYNMFITDTKNGTRNAILRTYGGVRPYVSVGYFSGSTGYATLHIGVAPK